MANTKQLALYEEVLLLSLRDREGTISGGFPDYAVAAAVLADLAMEGRIAITSDSNPFVEPLDSTSLKDPVLDRCLGRIHDVKRRARLQDWVQRLANMDRLRHEAAARLVERGILRADQDRVLWVFKRRIYPELDPKPERRLVERLRKAIFRDVGTVDARTAALVALCDGTGLLDLTFGRKEVKKRRKRIEQIANGDSCGRAAKQAIDACLAVIAVVCALSAVTVVTS